MTDQLLTLDQVCAMVQLSPESVRRAVRRGDLAASKLGGRFRFRPLDVETYIDSRLVTPAVAAPRAHGEIVSAPSAVPPKTAAPTSFRERARRNREAKAA
jgi:excisionase family DNA binding protein